MAHKLTVRVGGGSAATTWDVTPQLPVYEVSMGGPNSSLVDGGMRFDNGGACQNQFHVIDDVGEIPKSDLTKNLASHNVVLWTEDGPGFDCWLTRGRISMKEIDGGDHPWGDSRTFTVTYDDANVDLRGLALAEPWVRSAETDVVRVEACVTAFLSGDPRATTDITSGTAHLVPNTLTTTMPAKTYPAGTEVQDILADCATTAGKVFGVVIHHVSDASHLCLLYIDDNDHTTYKSTVSISDDLDDIDNSLVFAPIWDQGPAAIEEGGVDPVSLVVSNYGTGTASYTTVSAGTAITDAYDYWAVSYNDPISETAAQAASRAAAQLGAHSKEHVTHQVTIKLPADKVDLLTAGMSIDIKSARSMGGLYLGTTQTRRIAQLKWEPIAPDVGAVVGHYYAHMQLDRPPRIPAQTLPLGPKPPAPGQASGFISGGECSFTDSGAAGILFTPTVHAGESIIVWVGTYGSTVTGPSALSWAETEVGGDEEALTKVKEFTAHTNIGGGSEDVGIQAWYIASPTPGTRNILAGSGGQYFYSYAIVSVNNTSPTFTTASGTDASAEISVTSAVGDLLVGCMQLYAQGAGDPGTVDGDQTEVCTKDKPGINDDQAHALEYLEASTAGTKTFSRALGGSKNWGYVLAKFAGVGADTTQPIGETGEDDAGTSDTYAPLDHVHAHGSLTDANDYHDADQVSIDDSGGYFTGTNVETALQELGAAGASALIVEEADGSPSGTATKIVFPNSTLAVSGGTATYTPAAAGIVAQEADGSPSGTATVLVFPNSTLAVSGGTATYTPTATSGLIIEEADGSPTGTATKLILPNSTLSYSGGTATYTPTATSGIVVQEDATTEGTATVLNFSTNLNLAYSGGTATITADSGGVGAGAWLDNLASGNAPGGTDDDEFSDDSLTGWTAVTVSGTAVWTEDGDSLSVRYNSQTLPDVAAQLKSIGSNVAGTKIQTAIRLLGTEDYTIAGILFTDGTTTTSNAIWQVLTNEATFQMHAGTLTNMNQAKLNFAYKSRSGWIHLRMTWVSANTWRAEWSPDGISWSAFSQADQSFTLTPTHFGVGVSSFGNTKDHIATFEYFRVS